MPNGVPKIAIVGHGRAGKDTAAAWLGSNTNLRNWGSTSETMMPLVALATGRTMDECFADRHDNRQFWKTFCDDFRLGLLGWLPDALSGGPLPDEIEATDTVIALRQCPSMVLANDPAKIIRLHLRKADIVPGIRGEIELLEAKRQGLLDVVIWVENPRVPKDFTVDFRKEDADFIVLNEGPLDVYYARLQRIALALRDVKVNARAGA